MRSVFTKDLTKSFLSGRSDNIEVHHVFGGYNRDKSTKYGYVVPLHYTEHPNGAWARMNWVAECDRLSEIDTMLKRMAQRHYEDNYGSRFDFIKEFGRNYLD